MEKLKESERTLLVNDIVDQSNQPPKITVSIHNRCGRVNSNLAGKVIFRQIMSKQHYEVK